MNAATGTAGGASLSFPPDHPAFAGHFPQAPMVPGVLLLDAALHAIEAALTAAPGSARCHITAVKFFRPVGPREPLSLAWQRAPGGGVEFEWCTGTERVASGSVTVTVTGTGTGTGAASAGAIPR